jgi:hypothetical protein
MRNHFLNSTIAVSLTLSACSLAPKYERPQMTLPTGWSNVAGVGATQQNTTLFWQEFGSADLNRLIDNALAQNLDLEAALHRIEQARAQAKSAAAPLYPSASASGSASRTFQGSARHHSVRAAGASATKGFVGKESQRGEVRRLSDRRERIRPRGAASRRHLGRDQFLCADLSLNDRIRIAEFNLKTPKRSCA